MTSTSAAPAIADDNDDEQKLSFVSLDDDKETILLNGEVKYAIALPVNISKKKALVKKDIIKKLILDGCEKFGFDYVSEDNIENAVKEVVSQFYERPRELKIASSMADVIRMNEGYVMTAAKIIGVSPPYKMITEVTLECSNCGAVFDGGDFKEKPLISFRQNMKYCPACSKGFDRHDLIAQYKHVDAKTITVQDVVDLSDDLEKLHVILLEDQTRKVRVGETATITGEVDVLNPSGAGGRKPTTIMYAKHIRYEREEEAPITEDDISLFKQFAQNPKHNVINELVSMFAPQVFGHSDAKLGILRSVVNVRETNHLTGLRSRTHTLLAGDPGTAKTILVTEATRVVPNSRYVTAQHASIKSALAIIEKELDGSKMLMLGAVPQSRNAICGINEIGSMPFEDQQHLADVLEEGRFTIDKYGIYQEINSPTTIIATTNPDGGYWNKSYGAPSLDQLPIKSNIRDRFDQTYIFEDFQTTEERREYAVSKGEIYQDPQSVKPDYDFLKRYLQYAASLPDPVLTPEATTMLSDFWIRLAEQGLAANRSYDSLFRIARGQARLHLKGEIDADIAREVMQDVHLMFVKMGKRVDPAVEDPRDLTYHEIIQYANTLDVPITFIEAARHVCAHNNSIKQYLGGKSRSIAENKRLRHVHDKFSDGAVVGKIKMGRGGLAVTITNTNPLTISKVEKNPATDVVNDVKKTEPDKGGGGGQSGQSSQVAAVESNNDNKPTVDQFDHFDQGKIVLRLLNSSMSDGQGGSKGYCTVEDFVFATQMAPNLHWSEVEAEQTFYALIEERKLVEIEPGKFKPSDGEA
jgi:DNA replicative helicase MCM subunit Mcm2 (Cdc46/Mcm family)